MNLSNLSWEEKDKLLEALVAERKSGYSIDNQQILDAVQYVIERVELLESVVMDELIGGIEESYKTNLRKKSISDLSERFGGDLDQFKDPYMKMMEGVTGGDLYADLLDQLDDDESGWEDEENPFDRDGRIPELIEMIKERMGGIMGMPGVEAAGVKVDLEDALGGEEEKDDKSDLVEKIKKMSKKQKNY